MTLVKRGENPFDQESTSTPCVGICSTTYGDLVCRGCKRFSHEVVRWNNLQLDQRNHVWNRLHRLRKESINACVRVHDMVLLIKNSQPFAEESDPPVEKRIYDVLLHVDLPLSESGIEVVGSDRVADRNEVLQRIEDEFYHRACANYSYAFKRSSQ